MNSDWLKEPLKMKKTIFLDLDGCVFHNGGESTSEIAVNLMENKQEVLLGSREKVDEWRAKGYHIVVTTGRPKSLASLTIHQLLVNGIVYDEIIFGCGQCRHIVNDENSRGQITGYANIIPRNAGIKVLDI